MNEDTKSTHLPVVLWSILASLALIAITRCGLSVAHAEPRNSLAYYLSLGYNVDTDSLTSKRYAENGSMLAFFISKQVSTTASNVSSISFRDVKLCSINGEESADSILSFEVLSGGRFTARCISIDPRTPNP